MNVFLTLDYELFMGDLTGSPMNCLIEPTNARCEMVEQDGVRFTIFVDAAYLLRLKQLSAIIPQLQKDFDMVCNHIQTLESRGHDIEFHFHPQWIYSEYDSMLNIWKMDRDHYKLSDMPEEDVRKYFPEAKELLDSLLRKRTIAFRAGGYSLTTYPNYYRLLTELGIKLDSSVCQRKKVIGKYQSYDYRRTPKKSQYRFIDSIDNMVNTGGIIELPITTSWIYPGPLYLYKKRQLVKKFGPCHRYFIGTGETSFLLLWKHIIQQTKKFFVGVSLDANCDYFLVENLWNLYNMALRQQRRNFVVIGHPKNASPESIKVLSYFLKEIKNSVSFLTFKEVRYE